MIGVGLVGAAAAGEASRIEQRDGRDGSIVSGEVVDFADCRYLVESPAMGRITLDQAGIRSLQPDGAPGGENCGYGAQIMVLRQPLMGDARIRGMITPPAERSARPGGAGRR